MPTVVYHSSARRGLTLVEPRASTHGTWVHATPDPVMSALFLSGLGGDFTCQVGRDPVTGKPYVCERFGGAFDLRYGGRAGAIYVLPGDGFLTGMTPWEEEVVAPVAVVPLREAPADDAAFHLLGLVGEGSLILVRYPGRIDDIPADDEDLVEKAALLAERSGRGALRGFETYHPRLVPRVLRRLGQT